MASALLTQPTGTYLAALPVHQLADPPSNPNRMSDITYTRLKRAIGSEGFNTAILARDLGGGIYEIVDGVHRVRAARELGVAEIPAWVYPEGACSDAKAKALQIGFNALTGEPDLTAVARALEEYALVDAGLAELAGYGAADAQALIDALQPVSLDELDAGPLPEQVREDEPVGPPPVYELTLAFSSRETLADVKRVLRKAAPGKTKDLAAGLVRLAGLDS